MDAQLLPWQGVCTVARMCIIAEVSEQLEAVLAKYQKGFLQPCRRVDQCWNAHLLLLLLQSCRQRSRALESKCQNA